VALTKEEVDVFLISAFSKGLLADAAHLLGAGDLSAEETGPCFLKVNPPCFAETARQRKLRRAQWSWLHDYNLWNGAGVPAAIAS